MNGQQLMLEQIIVYMIELGNMNKLKLKKELMKFAAHCKIRGGSSWYYIPEEGIDYYLNSLKSEREDKLKRILNK